jgi:hypothetical protein
MLPSGVLEGGWDRSAGSIKKKLLGAAAQVKAVFAPNTLLTRIMFRLNKVPDPDNGVASLEEAVIRNVRVGPPPARTVPVTVQLPPVRPAFEAAGLWKVMTEESKVKSP